MIKTKNKTTRTSHRTGLIAERIAVWCLRAKGYRILAQRYKTRYGEIDIVARHKDTIVFIEVKARKLKNDALESVTHKMKTRIERAALLYIAQHEYAQDMGVRFDFIALSPPFFFRHLDNAWRPAT
jgi:putative endonuclease